MSSTLDKVALEGAGSLALKTGFDLGWAPGTETYLTGKGIEGWTGSSPIRRSKAELLGAHGTHAERGFKDERLITVTGHHVAASRAAAGQFADNLAAYLGDGTEGVFRVDDASLGSRQVEVYLAAGGVDVTWTGGVDVGFQIFMVANDPRKYGTASVSAATGVPVPGGGLVFPLFSRTPTTSSTRVNLFPNPSIEAGTTGYTSAGNNPAILVRDTSVSYVGAASLKVAWSAAGTGVIETAISGANAAAASPGVTYTAAPYVRLTTGAVRNVNVYMNYFTAAGAYISQAVGANVAAVLGGWVRPGVTAVTPANTAFISVGYTFGAVTATDVFHVDALLVAPEPSAGTYFDGSTPGVQVDADSTRTYSWTGAANASTSVETTQDYSGPNGVLDIGAGGYPGRASSTNTGSADTGPVFTIWGDYVPGFTITDVATGRKLIYTETITTGQVLVLDTNDGSATLDGYAPRDSKLTVSDWTRVGGGESGVWQFESPGSTGAQFTVGVTPAWW